MKIVVLDGFVLNPGDISWEEMKALGEVVVYERTKKEEIIERIGEAEAVYTNKTPITKEVMEACPGMKFIGVLATGYNVVDVEAAKEKGILVTNVPAYGTDAVAQYTFALLLALCHHVESHSLAVKAGEWSNHIDWCFWKYPLVELSGKTMGIIGYGRIGQAVGKIAQAFGMKVLANAVHKKPELENERCQFVDLDTLFAQSDVISLHCPLFPETQGLINLENIGKMKDGVMIINTSRGPVVVEEDLKNALECGKVAAAAVDVVSVEPIRESNPLLQAPNCLITPHIAWASKEARQRLMHIAVENLRSYQAGKAQNVV